MDHELLNHLPPARRMEITANIHHKAFTPSEMARAAEEIEKFARASAKERMRAGRPSGNFPQGQTGKTMDKIGRIFGVSGKTLDKIKTVVRAADEDPKYKPLVEEMDRGGNIQPAFEKVSKEKKLDAKRKMAETFKAAKNEKVNLFHGDFRKMEIADDSVDLIFTDPPYLKEYIPVYGDLAIFAKRVLKEGGSLLCYAGHYAIPEILTLLGEHLRWHWLIVVHHSGPHKQMDGARVQVHYKPILWYTKGTARANRDYVQDFINSKKPEKIYHPWEQSIKEAEYYVNHLTLPGEVILDPFLGSGTTGQAAVQSNRFFIGAEINEEHFKLAQMRILESSNVSRCSASELDK